MKKKLAILAFVGLVLSQAMIVACAENGSVTQEAAEAMAPLIDDILDIIAFILKVVGIICGGFGIGNLLLSMTENGSGENRKAAAIFLVVGIILIFSKPLMKSLHLSSYLSDDIGSTKQTQTQVDETPPQQ